MQKEGLFQHHFQNNYMGQSISGRIGTTANVGVAKHALGAFYSQGTTYPLLVGKKRINIDPAEENTRVVILKGFLDINMLDSNQEYYSEVLED